MRAAVAAGFLVLAAGAAQAQLFADDDARKAILDLRSRLAASEEQAKTRTAELGEQVQALRRSLLDMNSQLEAIRAESARLRGTNEQLARDVSELQRKQRDVAQTAIASGSSSSHLVCNAALQSGILYESSGDKESARRHYEKVLSLDPDRYRNSLHQKARAGLSRLRSK